MIGHSKQKQIMHSRKQFILNKSELHHLETSTDNSRINNHGEITIKEETLIRTGFNDYQMKKEIASCKKEDALYASKWDTYQEIVLINQK